MKLVVYELKTTVYQEVTPDKNTQVYAIRPHLVKHGNFPGTVGLEIHDANGELVATSPTVLSASDLSGSEFFHGKVRFYITAQLLKDKVYRIVLTGSGGYSYSSTIFCGWANSFDLTSYEADYDYGCGINAPLALEIWEQE